MPAILENPWGAQKLHGMSASEAIVFQYRPLLLSIAMDMLGNLKDAEDAVQDTFLRWLERDTSHVQKTQPYLVTTLKNVCFNFSKQTQRFREMKKDFLEFRGREHFLPAYFSEFDMDKELARAYDTLTRKLNISEKSVFLMREIFNFDYQEIAAVVDKKAVNCRKILDRAKKRLEENNERFRCEADKVYASFQLFQEAYKHGKVNEFMASLKKEMQD